MVPASLSVRMDSLFKAFGTKESSKDMENIMEKMDHIKETGETISLMDLESKLGKIAVVFKEIIIKASNMEMGNIHGLINQRMKDTGKKVKLMEKEFIFMLMAEFMKVHLKTIKCKEKEFTHGQMEENILDHMKKTKSMVWGVITGLMVNFFKVNGRRAKDMVTGNLSIQTELLNKEFGRMIKKFKKALQEMKA